MIAEVYALNAVMFMACMCCLACWEHGRRDRWLLVFAFLLGLGLANHHTLAPLGPAGLVFVLCREWHVILRWRVVLACVLLFAIPLALYFYLPLASSYGPFMDWGHPQTFRAMIDHISRGQYTSHYEPQPRTLTSFVFQIVTLGRYYLDQFSPVVGVLLLIALPWALRNRNRKRAAWLFLALFGFASRWRLPGC